VLNYELPHVPEDYIHRIGRTGRAGAEGEAFSFVAPEEEKYLAEIEKLLKKKVTVVTPEGFDVESGRALRPSSSSRREGAERHERAPRSGGRSAGREGSGREAARPAAAEATGSAGTAAVRAPVRDAGREPAREPGRGESRREERERAYALNPDQPLPDRPAAPAADGGALGGGTGHAHRPAHRHARPVPALLMKRPAKEPEQV
jgi:ATP-dependent RNA helicase RhlE